MWRTASAGLHRVSTYGRTYSRPFNSFQRWMSDVVVAYGSQSGTAMSFAADLVDALEEGGVEDVELLDLDQFSPDDTLASCKVFVPVMACYGQGEPTDNAKHFYEWAMDGERSAEMNGINYAVFGLGSSKTHAEFYNVVGQRIDRRLEEMKGRRLMPFGEGDDSGSIEMDFEEWQDKIVPVIKASLSATPSEEAQKATPAPEPASAQPSTTTAIASQSLMQNDVYCVASASEDAAAMSGVPPTYSEYWASRLSMTDSTPHAKAGSPLSMQTAAKETESQAVPSPPSKVFPYKVLGNIQLNKGMPEVHAMTQLRLAPATAASGNTYRTGDHFVLFCPNRPEAVEYFLGIYGTEIEAAAPLQLNSAKTNTAVAEAPTNPVLSLLASPSGQARHTLASLFTFVVDIDGPVTPKVLRALAAAANEEERPWIEALIDRKTFLDHVRQPMVRLQDIMEAFPSARPPLPTLLQALSLLQPRRYSIASSPGYLAQECGTTVDAAPIDLCVRRVFRPRTLAATSALSQGPNLPHEEHAIAPFHGVASSWIASGTEGCHTAYGYPVPSHFGMPKDASTPLIMIAGGVGIAPFKGFLEERYLQKARGEALGPAVLFFGGRTPSDLVYMDLVEQAIKDGVLSACHLTAVMPDEGATAIGDFNAPSSHAFSLEEGLVTDVMQKHADMVAQYTKDGGAVYICGGATGFGHAVAEAFRSCLQKASGITNTKATAIWQRMLTGGRYVEDLSD